MKRTRIFSGISVVVLALVGIAATKATTKFATYYYQQSANVCSVVETVCDAQGANCTIKIGATTYNVFTTRNAAGTLCSGQALKLAN